MPQRSIRRFAALGARAIPAAIAIAFLAAALMPRAREAIAREVPVFSIWSPLCDLVLQQADSVSTYGLAPHWSLYQPLAEPGNVSQITQRVSGIQSGPTVSGTFLMIPWDSLAQAPDPTSLVLRTGGFSFSTSGDVQTLSVAFNPPLVLRNAPGVADPLRGNVAMRFENTTYSISLPLDMDPAADPTLPPALLQNGIDPLQPAPGAHPVDAVAFCGGDVGLQTLRVMQAVSTTNAQDFTTAKLFLQRFRVPADCELRWLELAFGFGGGGSGYGNPTIPASVALVDLQGVPDPPPQVLPEPLVSANLMGTPFPMWQSHIDFDHVITLSPGHDYGLLVSANGLFVPAMRQVTGHEGIPFTSAIFRLSERDTTADEWRTREHRALSFRLIGAPIAALDAPRGSRGVAAPPARTAEPDARRRAALDRRGPRAGGTGSARRPREAGGHGARER